MGKSSTVGCVDINNDYNNNTNNKRIMVLIKDLEGIDYDRAVEYTRENYRDIKKMSIEEINDMLLLSAFTFDETEEEEHYWHSVNERINNEKQ